MQQGSFVPFTDAVQLATPHTRACSPRAEAKAIYQELETRYIEAERLLVERSKLES
jgi:hypothetical protein